MKQHKKSGDSKLQDAEEARERDRENPSPSPEDLVDIHQDSAEQAKADGADEEVVTLKASALNQLVKSIKELQEKQKKHEERTELIEGSSKMRLPRKFLQCSTCRQEIYDESTKRGVCDGKHVYAFVAPPSMREFWKDFQGVRINGQTYSGPSMLPWRIADDVMAITKNFEAKEREKYIPRINNFGGHETAKLQGGHVPLINV